MASKDRLELLVVRPRGVTRRSSVITSAHASGGLLEWAYDVAARRLGGWIAVIAGDLLDEIERALPSGESTLSPGVRPPSAEALVRMVGAAVKQAAASFRPEVGLVCVFNDPDLVHELVGDDQLALAGRLTKLALTGYEVRPDLDPCTPPDWSEDQVRSRQQALLSDAFEDESALQAARTEILLEIAEEAHGGWAILPSRIVDGESRDASDVAEALGFTFEEPLADDAVFCRGRLPVGWTLALHETSPRLLWVKDEHGVPRARLRYRDAPHIREAELMILG